MTTAPQPAAQPQAMFVARIEARASKKMPIPGVSYSSEEYMVAIDITMQVPDYETLKSQIKVVQDLAEACVDEKFLRPAPASAAPAYPAPVAPQYPA